MKVFQQVQNSYKTGQFHFYLIYSIWRAYEKTYDYFPSLTNSEYEPYILKDASNNKINVLDLTIKDLQNKGTIDPTSYSENSWHNTRSMLTEQQS